MKEKKDRLVEILNLLKEGTAPLSGTKLANIFNVSRQVIVQDIALLKAQDYDIVSTNRGYKLNEIKDNNDNMVVRIIKTNHDDKEIENELNIIVDHGAICRDVFVWHRAYGKIEAKLNIKSRRDVKNLINSINAGISKPLKKLTDNYHYHTLAAPSEEILDEVIAELDKHNYLIPCDIKEE